MSFTSPPIRTKLLVVSLLRHHFLFSPATMTCWAKRLCGCIILMNVPAAMAGTTWPEGSTGTISLMNLLLTGLVVFMALGGSVLYLYRRARGRPRKPTRGSVQQGNLRASLWLEYLAWSNTGVETHHSVHEGGQLRMRDLENQLFREPELRRSFLSSLFHCSFSSYTSGSASSTSSLTLSSCGSSSRSSIDDNLAIRSNTPERPHISQPQISTADGTGSATTKDHGKIKTHKPIPSVQSAGPSRIPTAHKTRDRSQPGDTPPPKVHRATSSIENKSPNLPAAPSFVFSPSVEDHPTRPARTRSHLHTSSNSHTSSKTYPSLGLD